MRPLPGLTLLIGGARSGKSALGVRLASGFDGPVVFVATAIVGDEDMADRIERHQAERPRQWTTIERPTFNDGDAAAVDPDACLVLDCLTMWVNAQMTTCCARTERNDSTTNALGTNDAGIVEAAATLAAALARRSSPTVVISNEVGLGIVPLSALSRRYRDVLGSVNRVVAEAAAHTYFVSAGGLLPLQRPEEVFL